MAQPFRNPNVPHYVYVCLTPSLPPTKPLHGAPVITHWTTDTIPIPLCNASHEAIVIPAGTAISYVDSAVLLTQDSASTPTHRVTRHDPGRGESGGSTSHGKRTDRWRKTIWLERYFDLAQATANWDAKEVRALKQLLRKHASVWRAPGVVGKAIGGEHRIDTKDHRPIALPVRRIAWAERDKIGEEVQKMKAQNVVVDSDSPWSSPPVLVRKKDGSVRFCIDYRKLNEVTVADKYPLPRIDDVLDELNRGVFFSVIDLKSGYWQIPMRPEDAAKTAFRTVDGHYHFTVMPFGLKNAPATFQRMMDVVFSGMKWKGLMVYIFFFW